MTKFSIKSSQEKILSSIQNSNDIVFIRAYGNWGDELIYAGTRKLLSGVPYREVSITNMEDVFGDVALISGSGGWCMPYHDMPSFLPMIEKKFKRVIVLPSSYDITVKSVRSTLAATKAKVFAREEESFYQILNLCDAEIAHDCAFYFDFAPYLYCGRGVLNAFRTDMEASGAPLPSNNVDISVVCSSLDDWLWTIARHEVIRTDRAHVMIAAALLGKKVEYRSSNYHKVPAIAAYSLLSFPVTQVQSLEYSQQTGGIIPVSTKSEKDGRALESEADETRIALLSCSNENLSLFPLNFVESYQHTIVTIVMLSHGRLDVTLNSIQALRTHVRVPYKLLLIDNASGIQVQDKLKRVFGETDNEELILLDINLGCAGGRAYALSQVETKYVMFIDNDVELLPGALEQLLLVLESNPRVWAAAAKVVLPDGNLHLCGGDYVVENDVLKYNLLGFGTIWNDPALGDSGECRWVNGGSTLFRRNVFDLCPLDNRMSSYYEDLEWCYRAHRTRSPVFYRCTEALVLHHHKPKALWSNIPRERVRENAMILLEPIAKFWCDHGVILQNAFDFVPEIGGQNYRGISSMKLFLELIHARGKQWVLDQWNTHGLESLFLPQASDTAQIERKLGELTSALSHRQRIYEALLAELAIENETIKSIAETVFSSFEQPVREAQLISLNQGITERDEQIRQLRERKTQLQGQVGELLSSAQEAGTHIASLSQTVTERDGRIAAILSSTSWRLTKPMRWLGNRIKGARHLLRITPQIIARKGGIWRTCAAVLRIARREGIADIKNRIKQLLQFVKDRTWQLGRKWLPTPLKGWIKRVILRQSPPPWQPPQLIPSRQQDTKPGGSVPQLQLSKTGQYDVIILPIIDWGFRFQRPQQIARQFAKNGHRLFYLTTSFGSSENCQPTIKQIERNIAELQLPGPAHLNVYRHPIDEPTLERWLKAFDHLRRDYGLVEAVCLVQLPFWRPLAFQLRERFGWKVVYDCMDKHSGFSTNDTAMLKEEELLSCGSDLILVTSRTLLEEQRCSGSNCLLVPNACECDHFSISLDTAPSALAALSKPIIGYFGAISDWFDTELVAEMARLRPRWSFVLIGSTFGARLEPFQKLSNVNLLGEQPYQTLPAYLQAFDVCLIPFKLTPLTEATNPVKLYEYLSAGKPVVAVPLPELVPYDAEGLVYLGRSPQEFVEKIEQALQQNSAERVAARRHFAQQNTWEERFARIQPPIRQLYEKASIIVLTYNNLHMSKLCVESIIRNTLWPNFELIIVDNASTDGTRQYLRELSQQHSNIKLILNERNEGFARANNQGIQAAVGEYVVLLNNDTIVTRGWLGRLIRHLERDPGIGMVGPVTNSAGNEAKIDVSYATIEEMEEFAECRALEHEGQCFEIKMLALFCAVMRRKFFDEIGLLDERFEVGMFEDDDLALRAKQAGYKLVCCEDSFIYHFGRAAFGQLDDRKYLDLFDKNRRKFERKWATRWEPPRTRAWLCPDERLWVLKRKLDWLLKKHPDRAGIVIYPPTVDWGEALFQRPHQIARVLSNRGYLFFYCIVNPEVDGVVDFKMIAPNLYLCHTTLDVFSALPKPIVWVSRADHRRNIRYFDDPVVVYDYIDELEVFYTYSPDMVRDHDALVGSADLCLATATRLHEQIAARRSDALYCPNAADYAHFSSARQRNSARLPSDMERVLRDGGPVIGYYGALAGWFDYDLIRFIARARPHWSIVLIGPSYDGSLERADLQKLENVFWLGSKPYPALPDYLAFFDVATIPFKINNITLSTSPIKLFEYMAGGKPIITTDLPECRKYPGVLIAKTPQEFVERVEEGLNLRGNSEYLRLLDVQAREESWDRRVDAVIAALRSKGSWSPHSHRNDSNDSTLI